MKSTGKITAILAATAAMSMLFASSASAEDRHHDGTWRDSGSHSRDNGSHRDNNNYRNETRNNNRDTYRNDSRSNDYRHDSRSNNDRNESRGNDYRHETRNNNSYNYRNESRGNVYRNEGRDNHFSERGRISRFTHERDGYRVWLGGERSYWVPSYRLGGRRLGIGLELRLGGIFNGTYVDVDALGWPGDPYYNDGYYAPAPYSADGYLSGRVERVDLRYGTLLLRDERSGRVIEVDMRATDRRGGLDLDDLRPGDRVTLDGSWDRGYFHAYRIDGVRQY